MRQKPITVYVSDHCAFCNRAKNLLSERGLTFQVMNISGDPEKRQWLVDTTGYRTVPQIFIGAQPIGGYQELQALDAAGKLMELAQEA